MALPTSPETCTSVTASVSLVQSSHVAWSCLHCPQSAELGRAPRHAGSEGYAGTTTLHSFSLSHVCGEWGCRRLCTVSHCLACAVSGAWFEVNLADFPTPAPACSLAGLLPVLTIPGNAVLSCLPSEADLPLCSPHSTTLVGGGGHSQPLPSAPHCESVWVSHLWTCIWCHHLPLQGRWLTRQQTTLSVPNLGPDNYFLAFKNARF